MKKFIGVFAFLTFTLFTTASFAGYQLNPTQVVENMDNDCEKCGKDSCDGKCEAKAEKKECTKKEGDACCHKDGKKAVKEASEEKKECSSKEGTGAKKACCSKDKK